MPKIFSGVQVNRAGKTLRNYTGSRSDDSFTSAMEILSFWRFTHEIPLGIAFELLQRAALGHDKKAIFAKRLKRLPSIVNKLERFEQMKLGNMQDIGGCRAIISTEKKLRKIVRELKMLPEFRSSGSLRQKDYIKKPKPGGYRSFHLVGLFPDQNAKPRKIEVQLRTYFQHYWATALEIVDLFTGQALKSNQGDEEWKRFFFCVSDQLAAMENIPVFAAKSPQDRLKAFARSLGGNSVRIALLREAQRLYRNLKVEKRFEAFAGSLSIIDQELANNPQKGYLLLEINIPVGEVTSYVYGERDARNAENQYTKAEADNADNEGIVVALVSTTAVGGIKEAYPNFFADSSEFMKLVKLIMAIG